MPRPPFCCPPSPSRVQPHARIMTPPSAIAAMARNRVVGRANRIPWHLPDDFRWFKQSTLGGVLLMGRRTFESIGRPLPGRETFILSRSRFSAPGTRTFPDLPSVAHALAGDARRLWVCGGADVYRQLLPYCSDLYLSLVDAEPEGDAWFPPFEDRFHDEGEVHRADGFVVRRFVQPHPLSWPGSSEPSPR